MTKQTTGIVKTDKTPYLEAVFQANAAVAKAELNLLRMVAAAREAGCTWASIGRELLVSPQAAHERFAERILDMPRQAEAAGRLAAEFGAAAKKIRRESRTTQ